MSEFELDSRLATDSVLVAEGPLSQVRLMQPSLSSLRSRPPLNAKNR